MKKPKGCEESRKEKKERDREEKKRLFSQQENFQFNSLISTSFRTKIYPKRNSVQYMCYS